MVACRLCNSEVALVKAHAIPEAFFREIRDEQQRLLLIAGGAKHYPRKAPIGVYDRNILCAECEPKFGPIDDYGVDVLLRRFDHFFRPVAYGGEALAFSSSTADANRILRFLVSVLWRASVSKEVFYRRVNLGPIEDAARAAVIDRRGSIASDFDAVFSRWSEWSDPDTTSTGILNPHRERWDGINAYRIYLGHLVAYIKVDRRPFMSPFDALSLRSAPPIWTLVREFAGSKDMAVMKRTAELCELNRRRRARV